LISVVYFIVGAYGSNSGMLAPIQETWLQFLADRTNGCAHGSVLCLSVVICNVWQQTETPICHEWRPCSLFPC